MTKYSTNGSNNNVEVKLWLVLSSVTLIYLFLCLFLRIYNISDALDHGLPIISALKSGTGSFKYFLRDVEPGLHLVVYFFASLIHYITNYSYTYSVMVAMSLTIAIAKLVIFRFIYYNVFNKVPNKLYALLFSLSLLFIACPWLPFINKQSYQIMGTPSVYHNPTIIALIPFCLYFIKILFSDLTSKLVINETIILSLLLLISTLIKPAFTYMVIPSFGSFFLFNFRRLKHNIISYVIIVLPALLYMLYQFSLLSNHQGGVYFAPFYIFDHYSKHPLFCIVQAVFFPLLVSALCFLKRGELVISPELTVSWIMYLLALTLFMLFNIRGDVAGNFGWGYQIGLVFVYYYSIREYLFLLYAKDSIKSFNVFAFYLYCICFASGLYTFFPLWFGVSYSGYFHH